MRKTSHDGADSTSIPSGLENETRRPGIIKSKKGSIKRKVTSFSHEADDGIIEPLLQDTEMTEYANRSARYSLSKADSISEVDDLNIVSDSVAILSASMSISTDNNIRECLTSNICEAVSIHNRTNANVAGNVGAKRVITSKNPVLIELDGSKSSNFNSSPLIFTTAKIHNDGKTKPMEPVQGTSMPIVSTIEKRIVHMGIEDNIQINEVSNKMLSQKPTEESQVYNQKKIPNSLIVHEDSSEILGFKENINVSDRGHENRAKLSQLTKSSKGSNCLGKRDHNVSAESLVYSSTSNEQNSLKEIKYNVKIEKLCSTSKDHIKQPDSLQSNKKEFTKSVKEDQSKQGISGIPNLKDAISIDIPVNEIDSLIKNRGFECKKLQSQNKTSLEEANDNDASSKNFIEFSTGALQIGNVSSSIFATPSSSFTTITSSSQCTPTQIVDEKPCNAPKAIKNSMGEASSSSKTAVAGSFKIIDPTISVKTVKLFPLTGSNSVKPNIVSPQSSQTVNSTTKTQSPVSETLPSYIVPTLKIRIGVPVTSSTSIVSSSDNSKPEVSNSVTRVISTTSKKDKSAPNSK